MTVTVVVRFLDDRKHQMVGKLRPDLNAQPHSNLGIALRAAGRLEDAASAMRRAVAIDPEYIQGHYNLGVVFQDQGRHSEALSCFRNVLALKPDHAEAHYGLGELVSELGDYTAAAWHLRECLKCDPSDPLGARPLLASLGFASGPAEASIAYLQRLYNRKAETWDRAEGYVAHKLVARAVSQSVTRVDLDILEAGCGTGLVGQLIRTFASKLEGVDLSTRMLEHAHMKGIYTSLYEGNLVSLMKSSRRSYDVVASAASLIHFGDLQPVFSAAATALKKNGLFIFSLYSSVRPGHADYSISDHSGLAKAGCYAHSSQYVERAAKLSGFSTEALHQEVVEYNSQERITGSIVTLRRKHTS